MKKSDSVLSMNQTDDAKVILLILFFFVQIKSSLFKPYLNGPFLKFRFKIQLKIR